MRMLVTLSVHVMPKMELEIPHVESVQPVFLPSVGYSGITSLEKYAERVGGSQASPFANSYFHGLVWGNCAAKGSKMWNSIQCIAVD